MISGLNGESKGLGIAGIAISFRMAPASPICELQAATSCPREARTRASSTTTHSLPPRLPSVLLVRSIFMSARMVSNSQGKIRRPGVYREKKDISGLHQARQHCQAIFQWADIGGIDAPFPQRCLKTEEIVVCGRHHEPSRSVTGNQDLVPSGKTDMKRFLGFRNSIDDKELVNENMSALRVHVP